MKQSAMAPRTGRIIELDIAKGLGILSVILYNTLPASPLHTALGGYMMPLFFVVSGLVMQRDACSFSLRRFWEKNARLLFYYILFSAIYLLCSVVTCIAGNGSYKALALDGIAALVGCGFNVLWSNCFAVCSPTARCPAGHKGCSWPGCFCWQPV